MRQEIKELKELPLADLISAPLNAVIQAQNDAALSTVNFIQNVGFMPKDDEKDIFAEDNPSDVRMAVIKYQEEVAYEKTPKNGANPAVWETKKEERTLSIPFISLFNIPALEISEMKWDFNVKLKGMTQFATNLNTTTTTTSEGGGNLGANLSSFGLPISIGASMKVSTSSTTKFGLRYGEGHEATHQLSIGIKAVQAEPPKGVDRLLSLAEQMVQASIEARRIAAEKSKP